MDSTTSLILSRASLAGVSVAPDVASALAAYVELLAFWNRKINLTALPLEPANDEAIDRLIVEPLVAARRIRPEDRLAIDIGSGGGSPAIPLRIAAPELRFVLVEVKSKKAAFLRAVARELSLSNVAVENCAAADLLSRSNLAGAGDVVTMRAVRWDEPMATTVNGLLREGGRLFWFGAPGGADSIAGGGLRPESTESLPGGGELSVLGR